MSMSNGNFPLLYVVKMSLRRRVWGSKKAKTPLRSIKIVPKLFQKILAERCPLKNGQL